MLNLKKKNDMGSNDFKVYLHERYNQPKEEFCESMRPIEYGNIDFEFQKTLQYEETSCGNTMPNIDYDKLFVGARIYVDDSPIMSIGSRYKEAEVTHLYGGVMFYKFIDGDCEELHMNRYSFNFFRRTYPKIIVKPSSFNMVCDCEKTTFINYEEEEK
jgi:hypothetical protein